MPSFVGYIAATATPIVIVISMPASIAILELKQFDLMEFLIRQSFLFGIRNQNPYLEVVISKMFTISAGVVALKVVVVVNLGC